MIYNKLKYLKFDIMKKHRFFRSFQDNLNDLTSLFILLWNCAQILLLVRSKFKRID